MDLFEIASGCLYAVKYHGETFDEYNRIFEDHSNLEKVLDFFETNKWKIGQYYVKELGIPADETEAYANIVIEETLELEEHFEYLIDNSLNHTTPDLRGHFKTLEGFENADMPAMKSYGLGDPSLLRVYAIEVDKQCLIIFYSGIKIEHSLSQCPVLKDNVISKAHQVIDFLIENDATDVPNLGKVAK